MHLDLIPPPSRVSGVYFRSHDRPTGGACTEEGGGAAAAGCDAEGPADDRPGVHGFDGESTAAARFNFTACLE
jgi:hypothetical protein